MKRVKRGSAEASVRSAMAHVYAEECIREHTPRGTERALRFLMRNPDDPESYGSSDMVCALAVLGKTVATLHDMPADSFFAALFLLSSEVDIEVKQGEDGDLIVVVNDAEPPPNAELPS